MDAKTLQTVLNDQNLSQERKFKFISQCKLSYSTLFELLESYKYEDEIYSMLYHFVVYEDDRFISKLKRKKKKLTNNKKEKRIHKTRRKIRNDKY